MGDIETRCKLYNRMHGTSLTPEEYYKQDTEQVNKADKILAKEFKTTIGIERNIKNKIMRKLQSVRSRFNADNTLIWFWYKYVPDY